MAGVPTLDTAFFLPLTINSLHGMMADNDGIRRSVCLFNRVASQGVQVLLEARRTSMVHRVFMQLDTPSIFLLIIELNRSIYSSYIICQWQLFQQHHQHQSRMQSVPVRFIDCDNSQLVVTWYLLSEVEGRQFIDL